MQPPCRNTVQRFPSRLDDKYTDRWCVQERESGGEKGRLERRRRGKKVKRCRKDVGKGYEKCKRKRRIVKERKVAVRAAGTTAQTRLMGWTKRHKRDFGGRKRCRRRVKEWVHIQLIKTTCVCLRWGHRSAAHTCEERMPSLAPIRGTARLFSQFTFSCQLSVLAKTFTMSSPLRLSPQTDK